MSYTVDVFNINWEKIDTRNLSDSIFNDDNINKKLIHEFVLLQLSNSRKNIAHVKTRWEVVWSWRKLFRQKWTWRARVGDAASPIRRHWWKSFWPRNVRNFTKDMTKKARKKALFGSLTLKAREWQLLCFDSFPFDNIKTKNAVSALDNNWLSWQKILLVVSKWDDIAIKSFRNIPNIKYIYVDYVNPYDLLTHNKIVFFSSSLNKLESIS